MPCWLENADEFSEVWDQQLSHQFNIVQSLSLSILLFRFEDIILCYQVDKGHSTRTTFHRDPSGFFRPFPEISNWNRPFRSETSEYEFPYSFDCLWTKSQAFLSFKKWATNAILPGKTEKVYYDLVCSTSDLLRKMNQIDETSKYDLLSFSGQPQSLSIFRQLILASFKI